MQNKKKTNRMPPNLDHLGPAAPPGAGPDGSRVLKDKKPSGETMKAAIEVLAESLNYWKAEIDSMTKVKEIQDPKDPEKTIIVQPVFDKERYENLLMKCVMSTKLLLTAYGPAPPQADKELMRFILILESYQERHNHQDEKQEAGIEENDEPGSKIEKKSKENEQKTLDQLFS